MRLQCAQCDQLRHLCIMHRERTAEGGTNQKPELLSTWKLCACPEGFAALAASEASAFQSWQLPVGFWSVSLYLLRPSTPRFSARPTTIVWRFRSILLSLSLFLPSLFPRYDWRLLRRL